MNKHLNGLTSIFLFFQHALCHSGHCWGILDISGLKAFIREPTILTWSPVKGTWVLVTTFAKNFHVFSLPLADSTANMGFFFKQNVTSWLSLLKMFFTSLV